ncbi:TPA: hypothetical protein ACNEJR_003717 [Escherichia coli]
MCDEALTLEQAHECKQVLAMCKEHDLPLADLPYIWDKYQEQANEARRLDIELKRVNDVERKAGIANGNMERELQRLRQLTNEQAKIIQSDNIELTSLRELGLDSAAQLRNITDLELQVEELTCKYESVLLRCKHFEGLADQTRIDDLEDLVSHYRCCINGAKDIARISHFSNELRLHLIRVVLGVFEPKVKTNGA